MPDFIIWYQDGSNYSSDDGPPEKAPRDGVEVVVVKNKTYGRLIWHRYEGYSWQDGTWVPHNDREGVEQFKRLHPDGIILNGFYITDEAMLRIYQMALAHADHRLPATTNLPAPDTPLPTRFRAYLFDDEGFSR